MDDAIKRAVRTFVQGALAVLIVLAVPALNDIVDVVRTGGEAEIDLNFWSSVAIAAVAGGLAALISFGQNLFEDKTHTKTLPK